MAFDIRDFIPELTNCSSRGGETTADCPVCDTIGSLKINNKSGKYATYKCSCTKQIASHLTRPPEKVERKKASKEWIYHNRDGQPLVKVVRVDDGKGSRQFFQKHWNGKTWVNGYGKVNRKEIPVYRYAEVRKAIAAGETIWIAEGEGCADALWELGLPATTNIGGSRKWLDHHGQDLEGAKEIILCPDRDWKGVAHAEAIAASLPGILKFKIKWLYAMPDSTFWNPDYLPKSAGLDVVDWIKGGATKEMILAAIEGKPRAFPIPEQKSASKVVPFPSVEKMSWDDIEEKIEYWIQEEVEGSELRKAIAQLADASHRYPREIEEFYQAKLKEQQRREAIAEQSQGFADLLEHQQHEFNPFEILPPELASILQTKAESDRLDPVRLWQNLAPAIGTMLGGRVSVIAKDAVSESDQWREYPIFFTADISPPSSGKSNANKAIWQPIKDLQKAEYERLEESLRELQKIESEWGTICKEERGDLIGTEADPNFYREQHCKLKKWIFDVGQMEAVLRRLSEQQPFQGTTWLADELKGLFQGLDQYKSGGKGDSLQILLEAWNGPTTKMIDRVDLKNSYRLSGQTLNICGGIQPEIAKTIWNSDSDDDGFLSRMLPAMPRIPDNFAEWSDTQVHVYEPLKRLYETLAAIPEMAIRIPASIKYLWQNQWESLSTQYLQEMESNPAFAYFLGKQKSYTMRFALVLHCIDWAYGKTQNLNELSESALIRAIALSQYYVSQFRLLQAQGTKKGETPLDGALLKIWEKCRSLSTISTSDISRMNLKVDGKRVNAAMALNLLQTLADSGYGQLQGKKLHAGKVENVEKMLKDFQPPQTHTGQGIQQKVEKVETYPPSSEKSHDTKDSVAPNSHLPIENVQPFQQNAETQSQQGENGVETVSTFFNISTIERAQFLATCRNMARGEMTAPVEMNVYLDTFGVAQLEMWVRSTDNQQALDGFNLWNQQRVSEA